MEKETKKWFFVDLHGFTKGILMRELREPMVLWKTDDELVNHKFSDDWLAGLSNGNGFIHITELQPDGKEVGRHDLKNRIRERAKNR